MEGREVGVEVLGAEARVGTVMVVKGMEVLAEDWKEFGVAGRATEVGERASEEVGRVREDWGMVTGVMGEEDLALAAMGLEEAG